MPAGFTCRRRRVEWAGGVALGEWQPLGQVLEEKTLGALSKGDRSKTKHRQTRGSRKGLKKGRGNYWASVALVWCFESCKIENVRKNADRASKSVIEGIGEVRRNFTKHQ